MKTKLSPRRLALFLVPAALLFSFLASSCRAAPGVPRQHLLLDSDWRFQRVPTALRNAASITEWRWKADAQGKLDADTISAYGLDESGWQNAAVGENVFAGHPGFAWFRTTLPDAAGPGRTLHFEGVYDDAAVYLNGQKLLLHKGWADPFDVALDPVWNTNGPNVLVMLVENFSGNGGIGKPVTLGTAPDILADTRANLTFNDQSWQKVHLPHDYVVEGSFTQGADVGHGSLPLVPAWYRRVFTLPISDKGRSIWVNFDGVYRDAHVYLNGKLLGEHPSGYTDFRYNISQLIHFGSPNVLAVRVDPRHTEGWWYEGGGIYRHVWLNIASALHVAPNGTFVMSHVRDPLGHPAATLTIQTSLDQTRLDNAATAQTCRIVSRVFDPSGTVVVTAASTIKIKAGAHALSLTQSALVPRASLWSLEHPSMYRLHTEVWAGKQQVDAVDTPFGIRTIHFDPSTGFYLNGRPVKIKGTCNHQDFAGVGLAVPDTLQEWRVRQLRVMGSNAWRTAHNPPNTELLDACDRQGMLVMDENRHLGDTYQTKSSPDTPYADLSDLNAMILRDRNHPSVILWSLCNEENAVQWSDAGAHIFQAMANRVRCLDPTRLITSAMNSDAEGGFSPVEDVRGFNYAVNAYARYHKDRPFQPLFGSETSSAVAVRGIYVRDDAAGYVTNYDQAGGDWANSTEDAWQPIAEAAYMAGGFVWTGFDYKGEPTPYVWPDINSNFGILDMCGFPKDDYYYYKAWWGSTPTVHLFPHWNWQGQEGKPIEVWCYGNASRVELFLNGQSLGMKEMPAYRHAEWSVPYAPGSLTVKGYDAAGTVVASDIVETTGVPAKLRLTAERTRLTADSEDVTVVAVSVLDAQGRVVPTADNRISFTVTGAGHIAGVGNGNPSDHDPDKASFRRAFSGSCMILVGANGTPGSIRLTAATLGLPPAHLNLSAHRP